MRPTRTGLLVVAATLVALAAAWLLGLPEVALVAFATLVLCATCAGVVLASRPRIAVERTITPPRIVQGASGEVRIRLTNRSARTSPLMRIEDRVGDSGATALTVAPLAGGAGIDGRYTLSPTRRGFHRVGPLTTVRSDVFDLFVSRGIVEGVTSFIVWPVVHPLPPLPAAPGDEPEHSATSPIASATMDEEFASLRDYVPGDDIRRIHWASTARHGTPVVRQVEQPWLRRVTVLVDLRSSADGEAFERVISAAASVLRVAAAEGTLIRLVRSDGGDTGFVAAAEQIETLTDELAGLSPVPPSASTAAAVIDLTASLGRVPGWLFVMTAADVAADLEVASSVDRVDSSVRVLRTSSVAGPPHDHVAIWSGAEPLAGPWAELLSGIGAGR